MRVSDQIHILSGVKKSAVYNLREGTVWAASDLEIGLLTWIATGREWAAYRFDVSKSEVLRSVREMREKGWLAAGIARKYDISLPRQKALEALPNILSHVWLEMTDGCNLSCKHCYSNSSPQSDVSSELKEDGLVEIIHKLASLPIKTLTYIGGEPTLRLKEISHLATVVAGLLPTTQQRIFSNLAISGISAKLIPLAKQFSFQIGTSLYGTSAETHDSMTRLSGSWLRTTENIKRLIESDIDIFVGFHVPYLSEQKKLEPESWLNSLGVRNYRITQPSKVGRGKESDWKNIPQENKQPKKMYFGDSGGWSDGHNCFKDHIAIAPNGTVRPCIMMRDISYGSLAEQSNLNEVFKSETFRKMSSLSKDKVDGCSVCEFRYGCFDCRPDAMNGSDNLYRKPDCGYDPRI